MLQKILVVGMLQKIEKRKTSFHRTNDNSVLINDTLITYAKAPKETFNYQYENFVKKLQRNISFKFHFTFNIFTLPGNHEIISLYMF